MACQSRSTFATLPSLAVVALLTSGVALAQPPGGREGGRGMFRMPLMTALDVDGDGEISSKEIDEAPGRLRALDANKDGKLTMDELRPAGGREGYGAAGAGGDEMVNRLMEYDTDKDGKLKAADLPERMRNIVPRADANKDGAVTREELIGMSRSEGGRRREGRRHDEHEEHEHEEEHEEDEDEEHEEEEDEHEHEEDEHEEEK
jgi:Ca2+-binding EF-hand superfamily protein